MIKILYVLHAWNNFAGVENHTKTLCKELSHLVEPAILYPESDRVVLEWRGKNILPGRPLGVLSPFQDRILDHAFHTALQKVEPDLIHLMHAVRWPLSVYEQVHMTGCPVIISSHDFFALTPDFTGQGSFSAQEMTSPSYAAQIFGQDISLYLAQRRSLIKSSYERAHLLTSPSPSLSKELQKVFPYTFKEVPYGIEPFSSSPLPTNRERKLKIAYLGSLLPQKGWPLMWEAICKVLEITDEIEFFVFGGGEIPSERKGVFFQGAYTPQQLPSLLEKVEVVFLPSQFRETYCIALSEVWQAKRVPAVSRIGALADRVSDGVQGKIFEPGSVEEIVQTILWFNDTVEWRNWKTPQPVTAKEMALQYAEQYSRLSQGDV